MGDVNGGSLARFFLMPVGLGGLGIDLTESRPLSFWNSDKATPTPQQKEKETSVENNSTKVKRASSLEAYTDSLQLGNADNSAIKKKTLLGD